MSEDNNNNKGSYDAEDLRRYQSGEMSSAERHALEKASQEDPMLGDALEGVRAADTDIRADVAALRRRLAERVGKNRPVIAAWRSPFRIAASVILLLGLSVLGYFLTIKSGSPKDIAVSPAAKQTPPAPGTAAAQPSPTLADADSAPPTAITAPVPAAPAEEPALSSSRADRKREKDANTEAKPKPDRTSTAPEQTGKAEKKIARPEAEAQFEKKAFSKEAGSNKDEAEKNDAAVSAPAPLREGQAATDSGLTPAPASGKATRAVQRSIAPSAASNELQGRAAGVDVGQRKSSPASYPERMDEDKVRAKRAAAADPVPGWKQYRQYLDGAKYQSSIDSSLHGTEKISFSVSPAGIPQNFVIDQSVSPAHDSLIVKIIRDGPKWKPARDSAERTSLKLEY